MSDNTSIDPIKILIIEGQPEDYLLIQTLVSRACGAKLELQWFQDFEAAEPVLMGSDYDVCLMDDRVGLQGDLSTACKALQGRLKVPLILITAQELPDADTIPAGVVDYLVLSRLSAERLERTIRDAVDGKKGARTVPVGHAEASPAQDRSQEALRESERRFAGMVANVPGMIYRARRCADTTLEFVYVSEGCRALFGLSPEQFHADPSMLAEMVHPADRASYDSTSAQANHERQAWHWEGRFLLPSGQEKIVQGLSNPDPQENGDIVWDGLLMDVTERVRAAQKAAHLAAIVESSHDAIKGKTLDGIVTSWNRAAEAMYGYSAAEIVGQPMALLLPPDRPHEIEGLLARIAVGEWVNSFETVRRAKDGTLVDISLTISPIRDSAGTVIGASSIAQDIRHRKEAEAQNQRQMLRFQALRNIDMAITASLDLRVTLNVLLDQVTTHLHVDSAAVLLLNPHTHRLEYTAGRGFRTTALQRGYLRIGEGYAGRAALERRMLNIPDLAHAAEEFVRMPLIAGEGFVSYWVVPLITKGRVEGVLEIFHRASLQADGDWLNFLEALAGQAAIAIENAALFNDLQRSNVELQIAYDSTLEGWSKALDLRDKETKGHTLRVTEATTSLAHAMNISDDDAIQMRRGALLHDIGKMGVPDSILLKPGPLTEEEWAIMKKHPVYAYELLAPIQFLAPALDIPYCHHEKWDGSGYPRGIQGGSGSNESDSHRLMPGRLVVFVQEYPQTSVVHHVNF